MSDIALTETHPAQTATPENKLHAPRMDPARKKFIKITSIALLIIGAIALIISATGCAMTDGLGHHGSLTNWGWALLASTAPIFIGGITLAVMTIFD